MSVNKRARLPNASQIIAQILTQMPVEIWAWRANTGAVKMDNRFVRFNIPGTADILFCLPSGGRLGGIEVKGPGDTQSPVQAAWAARLVRQGGIYVLAEHIKWRADGKPDVSHIIEAITP